MSTPKDFLKDLADLMDRHQMAFYKTNGFDIGDGLQREKLAAGWCSVIDANAIRHHLEKEEE